MRNILEHLFNYGTFSRKEAKEVLAKVASGKFPPTQVSAFLSVFRMRNITVEELSGFRDYLLEECRAIDLSEFDPVDLCGTGGDGKDTFNISTLASFVAAGAGVKVAKHGNHGVSSACGSSDVLKYLGYNFTNDVDILKKQIDEAGICFLHAPLFHPAMKNVAPVRREIGIRTFFNMLGPMVNPAFPQRQMVGVFSRQLQRYYKYIYQQEDKSYRILHGLDGYDEVSLTGGTQIIQPDREFILQPEQVGYKKITPDSLHGGKDVPASAAIFLKILKGKGTLEQNAVVSINAALAIQCCLLNLSLEDALAKAKESLNSRKAFQTFETLLSLN